MKREEKNRQTRRRIIDGALAEFSGQGYAAGSINSICAAQGLSKGIVYHYFATKDTLFLACVDECFRLLTAHLRARMQPSAGSARDRLEDYFTARLAFFREHPAYQRLFCEAVVTPPAHLRAEIQRQKRDFDALNTQILEELLAPVSLRAGVTKAEVIETFRQFQDCVNAHYQTAGMDAQEFEARERSCRKALDILLYGVLERKEETHV